jgi:Spy/CpxP family protein refolding chaperone
MARQLGWILAAAVILTPAAATAAPATEWPNVGTQREHDRAQQKPTKEDEPRRRFVKWWTEPEPRAELGITDAQSAAIEKIWQDYLPGQRKRWRELQKLEPALDKLIKEGTSDPDVVAREVERVENLTAEVRSARISMIYRMRHELTAGQRAKLKVMDERRHQSDARKSSDSGRHQ